MNGVGYKKECINQCSFEGFDIVIDIEQISNSNRRIECYFPCRTKHINTYKEVAKGVLLNTIWCGY
jgi:hypothetical protein